MSDPDKDRYNEKNTDIVFYYPREERQGRPSASDMFKTANTRPALARSIAGGRGNFFVLISIVLIAIMFIISLRHSSDQQRTELRLGQNTITLSALEEDGITILSINKAVLPRRTAYTGAVDISASPAGQGELNFVNHRIFFSNDSPEYFGFSLPFDAEEFIVILRTENETVSQTVRKSP